MAISFDTNFNSLPKEIQNDIYNFGKYIKQQDEIDSLLKNVSSKSLEELEDNTASLQQDVITLKNKHDRQTSSVANLQIEVKQVDRDAELAGYNMHYMKSSSTIQREVELPSKYFWLLLEQFHKRMTLINSQLQDIASQLRPREASSDSEENSYGSNSPMTPQILQNVLKYQHEAFMRIAGHISNVHEKVDKYRDSYLKKLQLEHGGVGVVRNPFEAADKSEAAEKIAIKKLTNSQVNSVPAMNGNMLVPSQTSSLPSQSAFGTQQTNAFGTSSGSFGGQSSSFFGSKPLNSFGTQQAGLLGTQPSSLFGSQPSNTFGSQSSNTFGSQSSNTFGSQSSNTFGSQSSNTFGTTANTMGLNSQNTGFGSQPNAIGTQSNMLSNPLSSVGASSNLFGTQSNLFTTGTSLSNDQGIQGGFNLAVSGSGGNKARSKKNKKR